MAVRTLQVTLGAAATPLLSAGAHQQVLWFTIQNNSAAAARIGDANVTATRGIALTPAGASYTVGPGPSNTGRDLGSWYVFGTATDVIDVVYDDGE